MDGSKFLEAVRRQDPDAPVLLLSARDAPRDIAKGLRIGADDYVRKPFSLEELLLRVAAILRRTNSGAEGDLSNVRCAGDEPRPHRCIGNPNRSSSPHGVSSPGGPHARKKSAAHPRAAAPRGLGIDFDSETSVLGHLHLVPAPQDPREGFSPISTVRGVGFKLVDA